MKKIIYLAICFISISCFNEPKKDSSKTTDGSITISSDINKVSSIEDFDYVGKENNGLRLVVKNKKYGFIDEFDNVVIDLHYDSAWDFQNGLARVYKRYSSTGGYPYTFKWGFINTNGEEVIPLIYEFAMPFENGAAEVEKDGIVFYIDEKGEKVNKLE